MSSAECNWRKISLVDLEEAELVELQRDATGKVWINIDGKCAIQIGKAVTVEINFPDGIELKN